MVHRPARVDDRTRAQHLRYCGRTAAALGLATAIAAAPSSRADAFVPVLTAIAAIAGTTEPYLGAQLRSAALMLAGAVYAAVAASAVQLGALGVGVATGWGLAAADGERHVPAHPLVVLVFAAPFLAAAALLRADGALAPFPTVASSLIGVLLITGVGAGGAVQPDLTSAVCAVTAAAGRLVAEGLLAAALVSAAAFLGGAERGLYAGSQLLSDQLMAIGAGISAAASVLLEGKDRNDTFDGGRNERAWPPVPSTPPASFSSPAAGTVSSPSAPPPPSLAVFTAVAGASAATMCSKSASNCTTVSAPPLRDTAVGSCPPPSSARADAETESFSRQPLNATCLTAVRLPRLGSSVCLVQLGTSVAEAADVKGDALDGGLPGRLPRLGSTSALSTLSTNAPNSINGAGSAPWGSSPCGGCPRRLPQVPRTGSAVSLPGIAAAAQPNYSSSILVSDCIAGADASVVPSPPRAVNGEELPYDVRDGVVIPPVQLLHVDSSTSRGPLAAAAAAGGLATAASDVGCGSSTSPTQLHDSFLPSLRSCRGPLTQRPQRVVSSTTLTALDSGCFLATRPSAWSLSRRTPAHGRQSSVRSSQVGSDPSISMSTSEGCNNGGYCGRAGHGDSGWSPSDTSTGGHADLIDRSAGHCNWDLASPSPRAAVRRLVRLDYVRRAAAIAAESVYRRVESMGSAESLAGLASESPLRLLLTESSLRSDPGSATFLSEVARDVEARTERVAPALTVANGTGEISLLQAEACTALVTSTGAVAQRTSCERAPGIKYGSIGGEQRWPRTTTASFAQPAPGAGSGLVDGSDRDHNPMGARMPSLCQRGSVSSGSPAVEVSPVDAPHSAADADTVFPPESCPTAAAAAAAAASASDSSDGEASCNGTFLGGDCRRASHRRGSRHSVEGLNAEVLLSSSDVAACLSALARAHELFAVGALEPKVGSPHLLAPEPTADLARLVRAAEGLLARAAALDTVAHGGTFDGASPSTARFFTDGGAASEWQSLFASTAAGCVVLGQWVGCDSHRRGNLADLNLPSDLDARTWGRRRSVLYRSVLHMHRRYWYAIGGGAEGGSDTAGIDGGSGDGDTPTNSGVATDAMRAAEMRAALYAAVASHSVAHALGTVVAAAHRVARAKAGPHTSAGLWRAIAFPIVATRSSVRRWVAGGLTWSGQGAFAAQNFVLLYTVLVFAVLAAPSATGGPPSETAWIYCSAALAAQASVEATVFIGGLRVVASSVGSATAYLFHVATKPLWGPAGQHVTHDAALVAYMVTFAAVTLAVVPARFRHAAFLTIVSNSIVALGPHTTAACEAARALAPLKMGSGASVMGACAPSASYAISRAVHVSLGALAAMVSHTLLLPRFAG